MIIPASLEATAVVLHRELLEKLQLICERTDLECDKKFSESVFLSEEYTKRLYRLIPEEGFMDSSSEILFFKSIKPLFVVEREYNQRLYHAFVFGKDDNSFLGRELCRMEKLLAEHKDFARYYHNGESQNDHAWFVQGQAPLPTSLCMQPWETNPRHTSARDNWVAGLLAVERYREWLTIKMQTLEKRL